MKQGKDVSTFVDGEYRNEKGVRDETDTTSKENSELCYKSKSKIPYSLYHTVVSKGGPRLATSSTGSLCKIQILGPLPTPTKSETTINDSKTQRSVL